VFEGRGRYKKHGKIQQPISDEAFIEGMKKGYFVERKHRGFCSLLFYSAVRKTEALRSVKEQFQLVDNEIIFDVGVRLKHGIETPALNIPLSAPYAKDIWNAVEDTAATYRVFPYSSKTGYNVVSRVFMYPHLLRLTRITRFFLDGWTIAQVKSWTGLSLQALDYYVGLVDIKRMGESLGQKKREG